MKLSIEIKGLGNRQKLSIFLKSRVAKKPLRRKDKMKKYVLKNWVQYLLIAVIGVSFMVLGGECDNFGLFVISKLVALVVMTVSGKLLLEQGNILD